MPRLYEDDNDPNFEIIRDANGRRVRILRDGGVLRTRMTAMDSLQKDVRRNVARLHDGHGNPVGHRPGFIVDDRISTDERQRAQTNIFLTWKTLGAPLTLRSAIPAR